MKKATRSVEQSSLSHGDVTTATAPNKICRVLAHMIDGHSLNRFEAERIGEHCLHSSISRLCNHYGLDFIRHTEAVPNNWGSPCRVVRYSLPVGQMTRARTLLLMLASTSGQRREVAA